MLLGGLNVVDDGSLFPLACAQLSHAHTAAMIPSPSAQCFGSVWWKKKDTNGGPALLFLFRKLSIYLVFPWKSLMVREALGPGRSNYDRRGGPSTAFPLVSWLHTTWRCGYYDQSWLMNSKRNRIWKVFILWCQLLVYYSKEGKGKLCCFLLIIHFISIIVISFQHHLSIYVPFSLRARLGASQRSCWSHYAGDGLGAMKQPPWWSPTMMLRIS